jgi:hypothetical protein
MEGKGCDHMAKHRTRGLFRRGPTNQCHTRATWVRPSDQELTRKGVALDFMPKVGFLPYNKDFNGFLSQISEI